MLRRVAVVAILLYIVSLVGVHAYVAAFVPSDCVCGHGASHTTTWCGPLFYKTCCGCGAR